MREKFPELKPLSQEQVDVVWRTGMVVLDTNTLLDLLRFTAESAEDMAAVLEEFRARLWLPRRVATEFYAGLAGIQADVEKPFATLNAGLVGAKRSVDDAIRAVRRSQRDRRLEFREYSRAVTSLVEDLSAKLAAERRALVSDVDRIGKMVGRIEELFDGRLGDGIPDAVVAHAGHYRHAFSVPPGFIDKNLGDLGIWMELLREGRRRKQPALLVTSDAKPDWWSPPGTPHPSLRREYLDASGQELHLMSLPDFLEMAKVNSVTLDEAKALETTRSSGVARDREAIDAVLLWAAGFFADRGVPNPRVGPAEYPLVALVTQQGRQQFTVSAIRCHSDLPDRATYQPIVDVVRDLPGHNYVALIFPSRETATAIAGDLPWEREYRGKEVEVIVGFIGDADTGPVFVEVPDHRLWYVGD